MNRYKLVTVTHKEVPLTQLGKYFIARQEGTKAEVVKAEAGTGNLADAKSCEAENNQSGLPVSDGAHQDTQQRRLHKLKEKFGFEELFYLETCNRVIYFFVTPAEADQPGNASSWDDNRLFTFFQYINPLLAEDELYRAVSSCRMFEGETAIRHLLEVSASLDSLVIGERQILGQLREAWTKCTEAGLTGDNLRLAFKYAIPAAKKIYTDTRIGDKPVSVVSLAARTIRDSRLKADSRILMVGAGQTNRLMAKFLRQFGFSQVDIFNRSIQAAKELAEGFQGQTGTLEELANYREDFDAMVVCTGATEPVISKALYAKLTAGKPEKSRILVDLAVPADIDPEILDAFPQQYTGIDQLRELAAQNLAFRKNELTRASVIVEEMVGDYQQVFRQRRMERAMTTIPTEVKALREKALQNVFRDEVESLDPNSRATLEKVLDYMEKKYVSIPMSAARKVMSGKF